MPTSTPRVETGSNPTLDCFTGAIVLREGAGAVGSSHLHDRPSASTPTPTPTPTSVQTPTRPSEPPPFFARQPALHPARVVVIGRPPASPPRRAPPAPRTSVGVRTRPLPWQAVGTFALGATLAALAGLFGKHGGLGLAQSQDG